MYLIVNVNVDLVTILTSAYPCPHVQYKCKSRYYFKQRNVLLETSFSQSHMSRIIQFKFIYARSCKACNATNCMCTE